MTLHGIAALTIAAASLAGAAHTADGIEIKNAIARVVVLPEARSDVSFEVHRGRADLPAIEAGRGLDGRIVLDGHVESGWIHSCSRHGGERGAVINAAHPPADLTIGLNGRRDVPLADAPLIVVHTPLDVKVWGGGAVFGAIPRSHSVHLATAGCGDWTVGHVSGALDVSVAGSGDVHAGSAGNLTASIAGSGDVTADRVADLHANIAGSGNVRVRRAEGQVRANIVGSGDLEVAEGHATKLDANIAGSGDVRFGGEADTVNASIAGSGDVRVRAVKGAVRKSIMGSGSVVVGG